MDQIGCDWWKDYFYKYTGRKKRGNDWAELGNLFDNCLDYNWREQCNWQNKIEKSGKETKTNKN